jgi:hypothetical protein
MPTYPLFRKRPSLAARMDLGLPRDAKEWPRGTERPPRKETPPPEKK